MRTVLTSLVFVFAATGIVHAQDKLQTISDDTHKQLAKRFETLEWHAPDPWGTIAWAGKEPKVGPGLIPMVQGSNAFPPPGTPDLGVPFGFILSLPPFEQFKFQSRMVMDLKNLRYLVLRGYRYELNDLKNLAKLPALAMLQMERADDDLLLVLKDFPAIEHLDFRVSGMITSKGVQSLTEMKKLRWLKISSREFKEADYLEIAKLKKLTHLDLSYGQATNAVVQQIKEMPDLVELNLYGNQGLTGACLKDIKEMKKLRALDIHTLRDLNDGLRELKDMKQLRALRILFGSNADTLAILGEFTQLEHLDVGGTSAGAEALQKLKKALPKCRVVP